MHAQAKSEWPIKIKVGSVIVKVYRTPTRGNDGYTLAYHEGARRVRRFFGDLAEARREGRTVAAKLNAGEGDALELTGKDRDAYLHALHKLKPLGVGLVPAIDEYAAAKKYDVPLAIAARDYHDAHAAKLPDKMVEEVYQEMLAAKEKDGAGKAYLVDLKTRLGRFARDFKDNISSIKADDISTWLRSLDLSARSRRNHRNAIVALFNFARDEKGYLVRERKTAAELSARVKVRSASISHFSPVEFAKLLSAADAELLPFFVFGGFCGLRTIEIKRLKWEDVRWAESHIIISAEGSKQGAARRRRVPPLTAPAAAWLAGYKAKQGKVLSFSADNLYKRLEPVCKAAEVTWKDNALRHSFITYRLATTKDFVQTAFEAGNSVQVIRSNYDAVATEQEGKLWFSIMPETAENVVQMKGAA